MWGRGFLILIAASLLCEPLMQGVTAFFISSDKCYITVVTCREVIDVLPNGSVCIQFSLFMNVTRGNMTSFRLHLGDLADPTQPIKLLMPSNLLEYFSYRIIEGAPLNPVVEINTTRMVREGDTITFDGKIISVGRIRTEDTTKYLSVPFGTWWDEPNRIHIAEWTIKVGVPRLYEIVDTDVRIMEEDPEYRPNILRESSPRVATFVFTNISLKNAPASLAVTWTLSPVEFQKTIYWASIHVATVAFAVTVFGPLVGSHKRKAFAFWSSVLFCTTVITSFIAISNEWPKTTMNMVLVSIYTIIFLPVACIIMARRIPRTPGGAHPWHNFRKRLGDWRPDRLILGRGKGL